MKDETFEVSRDGKSVGYFSSADIRKALESGRLLPTDYYHQTDKDRWVQLSVHFADSGKDDEASNRGRAKSSASPNYSYPKGIELTIRPEIVLTLPIKDSLNHETRGNFTCQCCLKDFDQPQNVSPVMSVVGSILSPIGLLLILANGKYLNALGLGLLAYGSALCVTSSLAYPRCPSCRSPNIKPNRA
jgi:hypothetical protein